jgi:hypothetical protein
MHISLNAHDGILAKLPKFLAALIEIDTEHFTNPFKLIVVEAIIPQLPPFVNLFSVFPSFLESDGLNTLRFLAFSTSYGRRLTLQSTNLFDKLLYPSSFYL